MCEHNFLTRSIFPLYFVLIVNKIMVRNFLREADRNYLQVQNRLNLFHIQSTFSINTLPYILPLISRPIYIYHFTPEFRLFELCKEKT